MAGTWLAIVRSRRVACIVAVGLRGLHLGPSTPARPCLRPASMSGLASLQCWLCPAARGGRLDGSELDSIARIQGRQDVWRGGANGGNRCHDHLGGRVRRRGYPVRAATASPPKPSTPPGTGCTVGTVYDWLNEDKRNAVEVILEERAGARDPEDRDGNDGSSNSRRSTESVHRRRAWLAGLGHHQP